MEILGRLFFLLSLNLLISQTLCDDMDENVENCNKLDSNLSDPSSFDGQFNSETNLRTTPSTNGSTIKFLLHANPKNSGASCDLKVGNLRSFQDCGVVKSSSMVLLLHGFLRSPDDFKYLTPAYLTNGFTNIILVDWSQLSGSILPNPLSIASYISVQNNLPIASKTITNFLKYALDNGYLSDFSKVHLVGHSIGSHLSGSIGNRVQKQYNAKIGRVTGLDPAGPFLQLQNPVDRLSPTVGAFVDAVHSDIYFFGTTKSLAQLDFYANSGAGIKNRLDPKCLSKTPALAEKIIEFLTLQVYGCPHGAAIQYYAQTLNKEKKYIACPCKGSNSLSPCPKPNSKCKNSTIFGEYVDQRARGKYYVNIAVEYT